jgi:hypothetical protein
MSARAQLQDLVVLFDASTLAIAREMATADFERIRCGEVRLPDREGEVVRAAYVTVGPGLRIVGLVFFLLPVDSEGRTPDPFNVPLQYLVEHAGVRHDLGIGAARVASRAQCPVAWLAVKLWEPTPGEEGHARVVQRAVMLNRMGLNSRPENVNDGEPMRREEPAGTPTPVFEIPPAAVTQWRIPAPTYAPVPAYAPAAAYAPVPAYAGAALHPPGPESAPVPEVQVQAPQPAHATVGRTPAFHHELAALEQGYLEQIRRLRAEILELKGALRTERDRNRRLRSIFRGDD